MPRLRQVPRSEVEDPVVLEQYEKLFGPDRDPVAEPGTRTGTPGNWWTVFAQVPDAFDHSMHGFRFYLNNPNRKLDPVLRELGQTRTGWLNECQFVYSQHCKMCRVVGMSEEKIAAISEWQAADCFDDREQAVLAYTDYLVLQRGRVPDGIFNKLKRYLSEVEIIELTYVIGMYDMHSIMTRAFRLEFDDRPDPIVEVAAPEGGEAQAFIDTPSQPQPRS